MMAFTMHNISNLNNYKFTEEDLKQYLSDLEHIVNIDSPTNHKEGIISLIDFFEKKAKECNMRSKRYLYNEDSGPVLLISNSDSEKVEQFDFLLVAHLDTVFEVGSAAKHPFKIDKAGIAHGCGVVDNKAGALLGFYLLSKINISNINVALLLNSNEETGSALNCKFIEQMAKKSKYTLVLEPTREDGSFVDKRYGMLNYKINFLGSKSKTGNFADGSSALLEAANFITQINTLNGSNNNNLINITIKSSPVKHLGEVIDDVTLGIQVRYLSSNSKEEIEKYIDIATKNKIVNNVQITMVELKHHPGMINNNDVSDLKDHIFRAGKKLNYDVKWSSSFGGSDGCFASLGSSAVLDGLGPLGGNFHTKEEYLDTNHVPKIFNILIETINQISNLEERN